jgi:hypothetical protein
MHMPTPLGWNSMLIGCSWQLVVYICGPVGIPQSRPFTLNVILWSYYIVLMSQPKTIEACTDQR